MEIFFGLIIDGSRIGIYELSNTPFFNGVFLYLKNSTRLGMLSVSFFSFLGGEVL
jgi:hypothetical protein